VVSVTDPLGRFVGLLDRPNPVYSHTNHLAIFHQKQTAGRFVYTNDNKRFVSLHNAQEPSLLLQVTSQWVTVDVPYSLCTSNVAFSGRIGNLKRSEVRVFVAVFVLSASG
jgi:hypothetical protein